MTLVFTLCSNNYLAQAITLGQSLLEHNLGYDFKIGLVDKKSRAINYGIIPYEIVEVENIGIAGFEEMFKRYSITELNTAVKPFYFQYFFKSYDTIDKFIFLDPDILVYQPFTELEESLLINEIVITPHFTTPIDDKKFQAENNFLNSGLYNLGFIALKRGKESLKLLEWWAKRLEKKAFIDFSNGMFTDQIWINFAPLFFEKVHILNHPGYNVAYWNLHERYLNNNSKVIKNGKSDNLVFFHFSGYDPFKPDILSKYQDRFSFNDRHDIIQLFEDYTQKLIENRYSEYIGYPSYYAVEKKKLDTAEYITLKKSIPIHKRISRGLILRFINWFNINVDYYTK